MHLLDELVAQTRADQITAACIVAAGGEVDIPNAAEQKVRFDEFLASETKALDPVTTERLALLGLKK